MLHLTKSSMLVVTWSVAANQIWFNYVGLSFHCSLFATNGGRHNIPFSESIHISTFKNVENGNDLHTLHAAFQGNLKLF